ncbi:uncharacterized protein C10orf143 homolog isoform X2 [Aptenodytes patagonicus]|uniref:uncharacterized protein C10orf143 homolog isoform X2 n=1 Tax=Aptenodytes patagonicus TaxID=9234 RepID=UPI003FA13C47
MELDSKQKISPDCGPWTTKTKQNSVIFENHGSRGTAQPCPRCIAGESILFFLTYLEHLRIRPTFLWISVEIERPVKFQEGCRWNTDLQKQEDFS